MLTRFQYAEHTNLVIPDRFLDEAEQVFEIERPEHYQPTTVERLASLIKAVQKREYDELSIIYQTKSDYEKEHGKIDLSRKNLAAESTAAAIKLPEPRQPGEMASAQFFKLDSGKYGLRVDEKVQPGEIVEVILKDGNTKKAVVGSFSHTADRGNRDDHHYYQLDEAKTEALTPRQTIAAEPIEASLGGRRQRRDHQATPEPSETETTPAIAAAEAAKREAEAQAAAQRQRGRSM